MPRNHLKTFPTAILRRGMVHFRPAAGSSGRILAGRQEASDPPAPDRALEPDDVNLLPPTESRT